MKRAVIVYTRETKQEILERGGTQSWVLTPEFVRTFDYVICARNPRAKDGPKDHSLRPEPSRSAFLVGRISSVDYQYSSNNRDRFIIRIDAYAEVLVEDFWEGQNPVRYTSEVEVRRRGLDLDSLEFKLLDLSLVRDDAALPAPVHHDVRQGLTIAEAKKGLAATFGVPVDAIEITIRG